LIYFFFLSVFYHIIQKIIYRIQTRGENTIKYTARQIQIGIFPLACYWMIAIGVPLINMAHRQNPEGFAEHSLTVGLFSFAIFVLFFTVRIMKLKFFYKTNKF